MKRTSYKDFRRIVWAHDRKCGRHDLPWRKTKDPYKILVSEIMLQQTQVKRVRSFYERFIRAFPTAERLASAPLIAILRLWQGLGYNRRAKQLRTAAQALAVQGVPETAKKLEALPGVGPYTARAVAAFAYNADVVFIETNIRTAIIHHFFQNRKKVSDREIERIVAGVLPRGKARKWYGALMDYGAHLKQSGVSYTKRSASYTKQSKFSGSLREARGTVLRVLSRGESSLAELVELLGAERRAHLRAALRALWNEGFVEKNGEHYRLVR